jgi:NTE family protein
LFRLRTPFSGDGESRSIYDNRIVRRTLEAVIDFDRLNAGSVRFCLAAVDIEAGEPVFFDTEKGDRIGTEHLLASSSLLPAFEPIRIGGRLLADGGLACNVPLEAEIGPQRSGPSEPLCLALDLFTPEGNRPAHLNRSTERSIDVFFGMQTRMRLAAFEREWALRAQLSETASGQNDARGVDLLYLSYRGPKEDAGFGKPFDLSPATLQERWREGSEAAKRALEVCRTLPADEAGGLRVHRIA